MINIEDILPVYKVENKAILSRRGDITIIYKLGLPDIFTQSGQEYEALHHAWIKAIKVLPRHSIVHKRDIFIRAGYHGKPGQSASFLAEASEAYFEGRPYLEHTCYILLTIQPGNRKAASSGYSGLMRKSPVPGQALNEQLYSDFMEKAGAFERILTDSGFISMQRLTDDELAGTKSQSGIIEQYCFLQGENERPVIKDVHLKDEIRIGDNHCQLFTLSDVEDLPSLCGSRVNYDKYSTDKTKFSIGFASPLGLLLDCNHIYNQFIFIGDAQKTLKGLEKKRLRLQSLSAYSRENAIARDATSDFLNEAIAEQRLPVKAHFNVMTWTSDPKQIQEIRNKVGSAMAQMDASGKQETDGAPQIWWAGLPGNAADFPMNDTFDTFLEQATCFLNLESNYRSAQSGFGIRLGDRLSGKPVRADISDEPMKKGFITNRNKMILGPSGSGKSFFTNHMVNSYYEQGSHIVLVDVGHSYKGLCDLVGGYYFTYEENNPIRFNPFYIAKGEVLDIEKKESLKTLLLALWKKENENFARSEYVAISNAITLYYRHLAKHPNIFPGFNSFYDFLMEEYLVVLENGKVKEKDFDIANLLYVLNPYYKGGEFDYLLNATENLDLLNERFIVFELDNIKSHEILFPVVTIIIMEVFISKMRKLPKNVRKVILIEEAWKAIAKDGMAEYIKYLFKTVRKFFGEAIVVTQEVEDILSSPIIKQAIVNNSDCKILLDQSKYQNKFDDVQELLGLTEKEKALILSMNKANHPSYKYKEVFISLGGQSSKVYRTEVSPSEYYAYTTEAAEKAKVLEYAERYGSMGKGIAAMVNKQSN
ncbi:TraG family conjugative transposon ATPase [Mucilaginibacter paludis]|uniref:Conjugation system ATPase, TraG family n=1 Tax=Mucilaginibacter paludis DSM 18603 TaxID=714943 RepID=H1YIA8_9SPHI|nr:TraG family conjugative transposon ATPase [Mucilaginibacter paludis]EHQ27521.1 conjugation system ATPase, TraG family [Mucilaginibacter paludis DSM 18603]